MESLHALTAPGPAACMSCESLRRSSASRPGGCRSRSPRRLGSLHRDAMPPTGSPAAASRQSPGRLCSREAGKQDGFRVDNADQVVRIPFAKRPLSDGEPERSAQLPCLHGPIGQFGRFSLIGKTQTSVPVGGEGAAVFQPPLPVLSQSPASSLPRQRRTARECREHIPWSHP